MTFVIVTIMALPVSTMAAPDRPLDRTQKIYSIHIAVYALNHFHTFDFIRCHEMYELKYRADMQRSAVYGRFYCVRHYCCSMAWVEFVLVSVDVKLQLCDRIEYENQFQNVRSKYRFMMLFEPSYLAH